MDLRNDEKLVVPEHFHLKTLDNGNDHLRTSIPYSARSSNFYNGEELNLASKV